MPNEANPTRSLTAHELNTDYLQPLMEKFELAGYNWMPEGIALLTFFEANLNQINTDLWIEIFSDIEDAMDNPQQFALLKAKLAGKSDHILQPLIPRLDEFAKKLIHCNFDAALGDISSFFPFFNPTIQSMLAEITQFLRGQADTGEDLLELTAIAKRLNAFDNPDALITLHKHLRTTGHFSFIQEKLPQLFTLYNNELLEQNIKRFREQQAYCKNYALPRYPIPRGLHFLMNTVAKQLEEQSHHLHLPLIVKASNALRDILFTMETRGFFQQGFNELTLQLNRLKKASPELRPLAAAMAQTSQVLLYNVYHELIKKLKNLKNDTTLQVAPYLEKLLHQIQQQLANKKTMPALVDLLADLYHFLTSNSPTAEAELIRTARCLQRTPSRALVFIGQTLSILLIAAGVALCAITPAGAGLIALGGAAVVATSFFGNKQTHQKENTLVDKIVQDFSQEPGYVFN